MTLRISGVSVEDHTKKQASDFIEHLRTRKFPVSRLFSTEEVARACRRYGLEWDDFEGDWFDVNHHEVRLTEKEQAGMEAWTAVNGMSERRQVATIDWEGQLYELRSQLKRVIRYRYVGTGSKTEGR